MNWAETDLAYLAGFVDGEGSITIFRAGQTAQKQRDYLRFEIFNTNHGVLTWIAGVLGGRNH